MKKEVLAQGAIEYLVIVATVIIISLIAVVLFISFSDSPSQQIRDSSSKVGGSVAGGIIIVESVVDSHGDSLIKLNNNSSDSITLKKISVGDVDNEYNNLLAGLDSEVFGLSGLASSCHCVSGQKSVNCEFRIEYLTASGIIKTENRTVTVQCVNNTTPSDPNSVINAIDSLAPRVVLNSPQGTLDDRIVDFNFTVTEANEVASCSLNYGSGSIPITSISSGTSVIEIRKTFGSDVSFDWNVTCVDGSGNIGVSNSMSIVIVTDTSPPVISLISPVDGNIFSGRDLVFSFSVIDDSGIESCTLNVGSDSNTYYNLDNGENTITYTKLGDDGDYDWNISCSDGSYSESSSSRVIFMDANSSQIATCIELQDMNKNLDGNYVLMNDIDCGFDTNNSSGRLWNGGYGFSPVGDCGPKNECIGQPGYYDYNYTFKGSLDSDGYEIRNLYINRTYWNPSGQGKVVVGLFGAVYPTVGFSNIHLVDFNITGASKVGPLVGLQPYKSGLVDSDYGVLNNSMSSGTINGDSSVGGLVGEWVGDISNSYSNANVISTSTSGIWVGGLVGRAYGLISDCYATGNVSGSTSSSASTVGGLIGALSNMGGGIIGGVNNSYATGNVIGYSSIGGLVGSSSSDINNSYSQGDVSGYGYSLGGLTGRVLGGVIFKSYSSGIVTKVNPSSSCTTGQIGGLVGYLSGSNGVNSSYSTSPVFGDCNVGGLVGKAEDPIYYSYSTGDVSGVGSNIGGLVGNLYMAGISNSYSLGDVNAPTNKIYGGLVGYSNGVNGTYGTITNSFSAGLVTAVPTNTTIGSGLVGGRGTYGSLPSVSYWDINTSKRNSSSGGTGRTTLQMYNDGNYSGWDFTNIWNSTGGVSYPTLKWQN